MSYRAFEMLDQDQKLRNKYHLKVCHFYKDFCKNILDWKGSVFDCLESLAENETNIWACIYWGINRKKEDIVFETEESWSWSNSQPPWMS